MLAVNLGCGLVLGLIVLFFFFEKWFNSTLIQEATSSVSKLMGGVCKRKNKGQCISSDPVVITFPIYIYIYIYKESGLLVVFGL